MTVSVWISRACYERKGPSLFSLRVVLVMWKFDCNFDLLRFRLAYFSNVSQMSPCCNHILCFEFVDWYSNLSLINIRELSEFYNKLNRVSLLLPDKNKEENLHYCFHCRIERHQMLIQLSCHFVKTEAVNLECCNSFRILVGF